MTWHVAITTSSANLSPSLRLITLGRFPTHTSRCRKTSRAHSVSVGLQTAVSLTCTRQSSMRTSHPCLRAPRTSSLRPRTSTRMFSSASRMRCTSKTTNLATCIVPWRYSRSRQIWLSRCPKPRGFSTSWTLKSSTRSGAAPSKKSMVKWASKCWQCSLRIQSRRYLSYTQGSKWVSIVSWLTERSAKATGGSSAKRTSKRVLITGHSISNLLKRSSNRQRLILARLRLSKVFLWSRRIEISFAVVTKIVSFTAPITSLSLFASSQTNNWAHLKFKPTLPWTLRMIPYSRIPPCFHRWDSYLTTKRPLSNR